MTDLASLTGDIAIVGVGNMGEAVLAGLIKAGIAGSRIKVAAHSRTTQVVDQYQVVPAEDAGEAAAGASVVLVAVKPNKVREVVTLMAPQLSADALIISLAASVPASDIATWASTWIDSPGSEPRQSCPAIIRAIPNTPARLGLGVTAIAAGPHATPEDMATAAAIFGAVGQVVTVDETLLPAVSSVAGCGPAYLFLVAEAMIDGAVRLGLTRDAASQLVSATFVGSAALLATDETPTQLRAQVTSPGGTTAAAIYELEAHAVRAAFSAAMQASVDKSNQRA